MVTEPRKVVFSGSIRIELVIAVTLGIVSLSLVVILAWSSPLDDFQKNIVWTLLAFGISGGSVFIPGLIEINLPRIAKAGGALGIFVLIFSQSPVGREVKNEVIDIVFPSEPADEAIKLFLSTTDEEKYEDAYLMASPWMRSAYTIGDFLRVFENERKPLGRPLSRLNIGVQAAQNPPGLPSGAYRSYVYRTRFEGYPDKNYIEALMLGVVHGKWSVFSYNAVKEQ